MAQGTKSYSAAAQTHPMRAHGMREAQLDVSGVFVATLVAEWSPDGGTTWNTLPILKQDGTIVQSVTAAGTYYLLYIPMPRRTSARAARPSPPAHRWQRSRRSNSVVHVGRFTRSISIPHSLARPIMRIGIYGNHLALASSRAPRWLSRQIRQLSGAAT
jgi:hypothetical protein